MVGDPSDTVPHRILELVLAAALAAAGSWVASYFTLSERVTRSEERIQALQLQLSSIETEFRIISDKLDVVRIMILQHNAQSPLPLPNERATIR